MDWRAQLRKMAAAALALMWVAETPYLIGGWEAASWIGIAAFVAYFGVAVSLSRPAQRVVIVAIAAIAIGAAIRYSVPGALLRGMRSAVLFAAFFSAMQMLRVALGTSPMIQAQRDRFSALPPGEQHDSATLRSHLLSCVLGAGGLAAVAPLLDLERPEPQRRAFAQSALQGFSLVALWSPFFVSVAVSTRLSPGVTLGAGVLSGLAMAAIGLVLSHVLYGGAMSRTWLSPLRRTIVEVAVLAAAIILANHWWGIGNLEAVALGIPVLSAWIARHALATRGARVARHWFVSLQAIAVEAVVVGVAMVMGEVVKELLAQGLFSFPPFVATWPAPALIALAAGVMLATSLVGLHPIVSASCILPVLAAVPKIHPLVATGSVLLGWMLSVLFSGFVVSVLYAATLFRVPEPDLVRGRNVRFCAMYAPLALAYLWALNALLLASR